MGLKVVKRDVDIAGKYLIFHVACIFWLLMKWSCSKTIVLLMLPSGSCCILPTGDVAPLRATAVRAPITPVDAVTIWARAASHRENPDLRRMAKSPTS